MISDVLDGIGTAAPNYEFASDLYELLDYKHLRGFKTFAQAKSIPRIPKIRRYFLPPKPLVFEGHLSALSRPFPFCQPHLNPPR